jgi:hypothetical protein
MKKIKQHAAIAGLGLTTLAYSGVSSAIGAADVTAVQTAFTNGTTGVAAVTTGIIAIGAVMTGLAIIYTWLRK